ncbi:3-carboxy-cis,cis-muconate cycloisomerase [Streptomyces sp. MTZ3.1]|uniref:3-carboxy-cis,cis-muconate cycloisomerase n=1 Tax=Streptomyces meridianus TaxID=2938945 RepID=A0ABT0X4G2_9ACTN|nr:3-carboxy-cis,cis-muconate cycloisomerase [Streptomyces meridianus]MCM2577434.1 3-carboxy-cis,cis-muconate cycloisomerase [Streptomyces meridianus]
MPSTDRPGEPHPHRDGADTGLLTPVAAGSDAEECTGDRALVRALLDAETALARAQARTGLAPGAAAEAVTAAASDTGHFDPAGLAVRARAGGNPVIPLVADLTAAVRERAPDAAEFVHRGATSQDILDTALMLMASRTLVAVLADLDRAAGALQRLSEEHRDSPMAGRTLTQHAVPTTFGLKAAGWRSLVLDAHDRLAAVRSALPAQLGGAAGTLAAFHAFAEADGTAPADAGTHGDATGAGGDREETDPGIRLIAAFAAETGLAAPELPWHTLRAPVADLAGALAFTAGALGKIAVDVLVLSRTEIGEAGEAAGGGSSAMPHKANPVRAALVAAAARQVPALACILYGSLAAEDERPAGAWHAEWQPLRTALRLVAGAARDCAELAEGLRVDPARMRRNLDKTGGLVITERLAAVLAPALGRDEARRLVADAARRSADAPGGPQPALREALVATGLFSGERLRNLTDPTGYTGSAGALTDRALRRNPVISVEPDRARPSGKPEAEETP